MARLRGISLKISAKCINFSMNINSGDKIIQLFQTSLSNEAWELLWMIVLIDNREIFISITTENIKRINYTALIGAKMHNSLIDIYENIFN
jgi:hypothetical protein